MRLSFLDGGENLNLIYRQSVNIFFVTLWQHTFKNKPNQPLFLKTLPTLCWNLKGLLITSRSHGKVSFLLLKLQIFFSFEPKFSVLHPKLLEISSPILILLFLFLGEKERIQSAGDNYKDSILPCGTLPAQTSVFTNDPFDRLFLKKLPPDSCTHSPDSFKVISH